VQGRFRRAQPVAQLVRQIAAEAAQQPGAVPAIAEALLSEGRGSDGVIEASER